MPGAKCSICTLATTRSSSSAVSASNGGWSARNARTSTAGAYAGRGNRPEPRGPADGSARRDHDRSRPADPARPVRERRVRPRAALAGRARGPPARPRGVRRRCVPARGLSPDLPPFALRGVDGAARARCLHPGGAPRGARGADVRTRRRVRRPARGHHRARGGGGRRRRRRVHHGRAGPPARIRPEPGLPRPGLLRGVPPAGLRRGRPAGVLLDRALPRGVLHPQRHERRRALRAPDLPGGLAAVAPDHGRDTPDRGGPVPRRTRPAPRPGAPERRLARLGAPRDGGHREPVPDPRLEDVHALPRLLRAGRRRVVARRPRARAPGGRRALHPSQPRARHPDDLRPQGSVRREPVRLADRHRPGRPQRTPTRTSSSTTPGSRRAPSRVRTPAPRRRSG